MLNINKAEMLDYLEVISNMWQIVMKTKTIIGLILFIVSYASADTISSFEIRVIEEMNKVRDNPKAYAEKHIAPLLNKFKGDTLYYTDKLVVITKEGISAVRECVEVLKVQEPSKPLTLSKGLSLGANDHIKDQNRTGRTGHLGSDSSRVGDRVSRYGKWRTVVSENIQYGIPDPVNIIVTFLIDDGFESRGHRRVILSKDYHYTGVAFGPHPVYQRMCVVTYACKYEEIR